MKHDGDMSFGVCEANHAQCPYSHYSTLETANHGDDGSVTPDGLGPVRQEMECRLNARRATNAAHIEIR
jgi:hypothetical protein